MNSILTSPEPDISLLSLVVKRWRLMLAIVFAVIGLAGLVTMVVPKKYESRMKFLVKNERADLVLTPDKNGSPAPQVEVSEAEVNSELELLRSRDILEAVVSDAHLYKPFQRRRASETSRLSIDRAVLRLQKDLNVEGIRKTNLIEATYRASNPDVAAFVLRDLGDRYLTEHLTVHSARGSYQFFTDQVEKYRAQLEQTKLALSSFHQQNQIFLLPQQQSALVTQLQQNQAVLKDLDVEIEDQQNRLSEVQHQLAAAPERVTTQVRQMPNQYAVEHLQTQLTDLENRRISLLMKYKIGDRLVREIEEEIQNTRQTLARVQSGAFPEQTSDRNTLYQSLQSENVQAEITLKGLQARRAAVAANVTSYLRQLRALDQSSLPLAALQEKLQQAEDNYRLYSRRLEEARLAESLDRQKFANVAVVESPVSSPVPVFPKLGLNLALGAALGLMLALALAFVVDSRGDTSSLSPPPLREKLYGSRSIPATASGD